MMPKDPIEAEITRQRLSESHKGKTPWNKGKKCPDISERQRGENNPMFGRTGDKNHFFGKHHTEEAKKINSEKHLGRHKGNKSPRWKPNIKKTCPTCGNIFEIKPGRGATRIYCSKKCSAKNTWKDPLKKEEMSKRQTGAIRSVSTGKKISESLKGKPKSAEHRENLRNSRIGSKASKETRRKMSVSRSGNKCHLWKGGTSFFPYCPKFNNRFKKNVRDRFHGECQFPGCGMTKEENGRELDVHHVFVEKMTCCEHKIKDMDAVRKRLPNTVAKFGEPNFTEEEIMYIRMVVPLCKKHQSKVTHESNDLAYEDTVYRKHFAELIMNEYDGKCFTSEEKIKEIQIVKAGGVLA